MTPTDLRENAFETLITSYLIDDAGYIDGLSTDYDRQHAVDFPKLLEFLTATQPDAVAQLGIAHPGPNQTEFLDRLKKVIDRDGLINALRKGLKHKHAKLDLFYGRPSPGNPLSKERYAANIFSVTRQLHYSLTKPNNALDLVVFINGLPIATFELKNTFTNQTADDAVRQYKIHRDPRELLFKFGRCAVHFAVDDREVFMCTHLQGQKSWFLPFNKGHNDGAGNPPNPHGIATDYLWKDIFSKPTLTDILENYALKVTQMDSDGKKKEKQIFPRYHQLDVVRHLLADAAHKGRGHRYLIQHSAGSGKSNSIAWLAHQLVDLQKKRQVIFDSILVVTDRVILDRQIRDTIKQFAQVSSVVGHAEESSQLRKYIEDGKKIITTTVQKFPVILDSIGNEHRKRTFAIIIDEAHSSQGGRTASKMSMTLAADPDRYFDGKPTVEETINHLMKSRKMLKNASYFAFTATPKNKTLELFGLEATGGDDEGKFHPFHTYTMKQAIQEGFILDVLEHYTPVDSYYRLVRTIEDDPLLDKKKANKKLRRYVESHDHAIGKKAEIMIDHFYGNSVNKIGGEARAMVITSSIQRAIQYYYAFQRILADQNRPHRALVAFSGEPEYKGISVTDAQLNGFSRTKIENKFIEDPYRFLIVADMFQTGYDEPLLHTMYVDKELSGIKAVQTLSRLNRAHPRKHDTFVLDFMNDEAVITEAFSDYYRSTILSGRTDSNRLHDLLSDLEGYQVFTDADVDTLVRLYLEDAPREELEPVLNRCTAVYREHLDEDGQVDFKSKSKSFCRTYNFLGAVLPFNYASWEKLSIFLNVLIPRLPAPVEEDLSQGILEAVDMESYRAEVRAMRSISLADADAEINPVPIGGGARMPEEEMVRVSSIIDEFNQLWGNIPWNDKDRIDQILDSEVPGIILKDQNYQQALKYSDEENIRVELNSALEKVMNEMVSNDSLRFEDVTQLYKMFTDNTEFRKWLVDKLFEETSRIFAEAEEQRTDQEEKEELTVSQLVRMEESDTLEFKSTLQWDVKEARKNKELIFSVIKTIAAFMNTHGGILLIGVEDNGDIFGLEHDIQLLKKKSIDGFQLLLTESIGKTLGNQWVPEVEITFETLEGKTVCKLSVPPLPVPVFCKGPKDKRFYVRQGNRTVFLDMEEAFAYKELHWPPTG